MASRIGFAVTPSVRRFILCVPRPLYDQFLPLLAALGFGHRIAAENERGVRLGITVPEEDYGLFILVEGLMRFKMATGDVVRVNLLRKWDQYKACLDRAYVETAHLPVDRFERTLVCAFAEDMGRASN